MLSLYLSMLVSHLAGKRRQKCGQAAGVNAKNIYMHVFLKLVPFTTQEQMLYLFIKRAIFSRNTCLRMSKA